MQPNPKQPIIDLISSVLPVGDRIVIIPDEKTKFTRNNIARSQIAKGEDETQIGTVVAVGPGYNTEYGQFIPTTSKPGDRVLLDKFNGVTIRIDKRGNVLPQHEDITEDRVPVRIVRQDGILWTFPTSWKNDN